MNEPTAKKERKGVPLRIYEDPEQVVVATGSYGAGHGLSVKLNYDAMEVPKDAIREDLEVLFDEAFERALEEVDG